MATLLRVPFAAFLLAFLAAPAQAKTGADASAVSVAKASATEQYERDVDEVASASQEKAISKLSVLLKKYRGTRQEPVLLSRLADLEQQNGAILFRIAHGRAHRNKKALDLTRYNRAMKLCIGTLNTLIAKYPDYVEIPHAYFVRGKALEEIENKAGATRDYLHLVQKFPTAEEAPSAYMALADFAIAANDHPKAISFLSEVEKLPGDPHYPFALYKLAWSNYNLKNIPAALSFAERHVAYYRGKKVASKGEAEGDGLATSDAALKENALLDITVFYHQGYEQGLPQYRLSEALPYFQKLESGPALGKMLLRFSRLLRSHGHDADLVAWKDQVLAAESDRPESLDVLLTAYEHQLNRRRYPALIESARDIVKLHAGHAKFESFGHAQKLLLDTAEGLQATILKNKAANPDEVRSLSLALAAIYDAFARIVDDADPRVPKVHYNLAETLFAIKDFPGATEHYRWVVEHGRWNGRDFSPAGVNDASLKAIAARHEILSQKHLTPKDVTAKPLTQNSEQKLDPLLEQWIDWVDTHLKKADLAKAPPGTRAATENFLFEANRALYLHNHVVQASERLKSFAEDHPTSIYAIPSASLVIDTSIASADWDKTHSLANDFMNVSEWKKTEFSKRLYAVASDAYYKTIEAKFHAGDFKGVTKSSEKFLKEYGASARLADCLILAGKAASSLHDREAAMNYYSRLIKESPHSGNTADALLARASMEEERYLLAPAAADYRAFLSLPPKQIQLEESKLVPLRKKALALTWIAADAADLRAALASKATCPESLADECEKYTALAALAASEKAGAEKTTEDAFERAKKTDGEAKTVWSAVALEGSKHLSHRDRLFLIRQVAAGWSDADPLVRYTLLPYLSASIPRTFQLTRLGMRSIAPLRADERYITRRIEVIHEMENAATKVMKLPWSRIRAESLNEIAFLYLELAHELSHLPAPKGLNPADTAAYDETIRKLTFPFEEKGQDMRTKAFEIASRFAIEDKSFARIAEPFFTDNPNQAKALKPVTPMARADELDLKFISRLDSPGKWERISLASRDTGKDNELNGVDDPALRLKTYWARALVQKRWQQIAFFMQEAQEKKLLTPGPLSIVKSVSLTAAGAQGEALAELQEGRRDLDAASKMMVTMTLVQYSVQSCARDRTKELLSDLLKEVPTDQLNREQASLVTTANAYADPKAPKSRKQ